MADSRRPWLLLALAWIAAFTALFDSNVVSLALPSMAADLHRSVLDLAWVVTAFLLPLAAALIAAGRLGDRFGARNLIVPGAGLFLAATAVAGVAPSFEVLVFARVVQGLAAAVLWTLSLAIVVTAFPPEKRPLAVSIYFTSGTLGAVIGPVVGGALTGLGGWRLVFFAQLPLPVIVLAASVAILPRTQGQRIRFDGPGIALASLFLLAANFALLRAPVAGWTDLAVLLGALVTVVALGLFVWRERSTDAPAVPLRVFGDRRFVVASLAGAAWFAITSSTVYPAISRERPGYRLGETPAVARGSERVHHLWSVGEPRSDRSLARARRLEGARRPDQGPPRWVRARNARGRRRTGIAAH